jgi:hypothetical protein
VGSLCDLTCWYARITANFGVHLGQLPKGFTISLRGGLIRSKPDA